MECQYELMTFGIPQQILPVNFNGEVNLTNHHEWIRQRQNIEAQQQLLNISDSMAVNSTNYCSDFETTQQVHDSDLDDYDDDGLQIGDDGILLSSSPNSATADPITSFNLDFDGIFDDNCFTPEEEHAPEQSVLPSSMSSPTSVTKTANDIKDEARPTKVSTPAKNNVSKKQTKKKKKKDGDEPCGGESSSLAVVAVPDHEDGKCLPGVYSTLCISIVRS